MKKNYYRFDRDVLSIHTECGEYKFKIANDTGLTKARQIAELMVGEMEKVEAKFQGEKEKSSPFAKLLLVNLNMADRYVRLANKYNALLGAQAGPADSTPGTGTLQPETMPSAVLPPLSAEVDPATMTMPSSEPESISFSPGDTMVPGTAMPAETTASPGTATPVETPATQGRSTPAEASTAPGTAASIETETESATATATDAPEAFEPPDVPSSDMAGSIPATATPPPGGEAPLRTQLAHARSEPTVGMPASGPKTIYGPQSDLQFTLTPASPEVPPAQFRINSQDPAVIPDGQSAAGADDAFKQPSLGFLRTKQPDVTVDHEAIRRDAELLEQKLGYFGIKGEVMGVSPGPVITTFEYKPAPGIKISKIVNLADDLALALSALSIRLVAPIPGKDVIGIEIPNPTMSIVPFIDIVGSDAFKRIDSRTPICLGKDIVGNPVVVGLERMPHLLIAGATGTGKSVALNAMITSILYKSPPDQVKFIMIDPKRIELSLFNDIPHLLTPVITDMRKANIALQWVVREMERRYEKLATLQVRNIEQYNQKVQTADLSEYEGDGPFDVFPYIVVIIDELADLMMTASKDIEFSLTRIAQMARAAGIHLILATQRPSVDVLTGIIKANFPTRISFQVSSKTDSRTIIDANGAETLLGRGDMLFVPPGTARLTRVHGTYLSEEELISITDFLKAQGKPDYILEVITEQEEEPVAVEISDDDYDEKYQAALEFVLSTRQASISGVQRALRVGYNRAARIIDLMEKKGIVSASDGVKPRQVLVDRTEWSSY